RESLSLAVLSGRVQFYRRCYDGSAAALSARRRAALEAAAVGLGADDAEHDLAEALDRLGAGLAIGLGDALALVLGELALELDALLGELEQALPAVAAARLLADEALAHELAQDAAQALLGDAQDAEQVGDAHLRMAADEIDDAVMGAAEAVFRQHGVGLGGEVAIGVIEQLDRLAQLLLAEEEQVGAGFYVSHVDLFSLDR